jgi:pyocin large subunit-like protein
MRVALRTAVGLVLVALLLLASGPGFRSRRQFDEHYAKHGREFGKISKQEYLRLAQALRDAPASGRILEARAPDGIVSRFDRRTGSFGAYNPDGTIRTFFIPNAGERYFHRQARKRDAE